MTEILVQGHASSPSQQQEDNHLNVIGPSDIVAGEKSFVSLSHGLICKPWHYREHAFYKHIRGTEFESFVPPYHGTEMIGNRPYLVLGDLTSRMKRASVIDIKMGTHLKEGIVPGWQYKDRAAKAELEAKTTSGQLGFRLSGMKIFQTDNTWARYNGKFGRSFTKETIKHGLLTCFDNGGYIRYDVIPPLRRRIASLIRVFEDQRRYKFFSCSLLVVYDGLPSSSSPSPSHIPSNESSPESSPLRGSPFGSCSPMTISPPLTPIGSPRILSGDGSQHSEPEVELRMIDFAGAYDSIDGGRDEGFLYGLKNLDRCLADILEETI